MNRIIISSKVDNVIDNHLRRIGNRVFLFPPFDLWVVLLMPDKLYIIVLFATITTHLFRLKKRARLLDSWRAISRMCNEIDRLFGEMRQKVIRTRTVPLECDTIRSSRYLYKEAIRRTRSSLLKLVRRIQFQRIRGSLLSKFYFERLWDKCDNSHINPSMTRFTANSSVIVINSSFSLKIFTNIRYFIF